MLRPKLFLLLLLIPGISWAQSNPALFQGEIPTAVQWNLFFSQKADYPITQLPSVINLNVSGIAAFSNRPTFNGKIPYDNGNLFAATSSVLGLTSPDGTTITNNNGNISVTYGTAANTAAEGNDPRIVGALSTSAAASTYETQSNANSTYATILSVTTNYAPLASPALTGTPTAPTANVGTNTTQIATTAFVTNAVASITGGTGLVASSIIGNLTSTGNSQSTALQITTNISVITNVPAGTGVLLSNVVGARQEILNRGSNNLLVYPALGATIENFGTNNPGTVLPGGSLTVECTTSIQCYARP